MRYEAFIARRLRFNEVESHRSASPSAVIAVAGIALAIVIMMVAIVVVLGFKHQIRDKVMGFDAQIKVRPYSDMYNTPDTGTQYTFVSLNDTLDRIIRSSLPDNANITLTLKQPGVIKTDTDYMGIVFKGMDDNYDWRFIADNLVSGSIPDYSDFDANKNRIIISQIMASALQIETGDKIYAHFFGDNNLRTRRFEIAGIYNSHFGDYDRLFAYAPIATIQSVGNLAPLTGSEIEIRGVENSHISTLCDSIQTRIYEACHNGELKQFYVTDNIYRSGALYFNWLDLLDTNVAVILLLMAFVSGFTLISCMFMIILERVNMIGVMKSLGATNAQIRRIFIYLTERLVVKGLVTGNIIVLSLILLQQHFHIIPLDPEAYYLSYVPVEINWWHILMLNISVIMASALILVVPSRLIAKISPAKTIRFE